VDSLDAARGNCIWLFGWTDPFKVSLLLYIVSLSLYVIIRCSFYPVGPRGRVYIFWYMQLIGGLLGGPDESWVTADRRKPSPVTPLFQNHMIVNMDLHLLSFHGILIVLSSYVFFFFYHQHTSRSEELLRCVYSKETMHAIGGGLGYLWISRRRKGVYVIIHFMCTI